MDKHALCSQGEAVAEACLLYSLLRHDIIMPFWSDTHSDIGL